MFTRVIKMVHLAGKKILWRVRILWHCFGPSLLNSDTHVVLYGLGGGHFIVVGFKNNTFH